MELLAWIAETDVYRLNRITEREQRQLLRLMSIRPEPPRPSRVVVEARIVSGPSPVTLPESLEWTGTSLDGRQVGFRSTAAIEIVACRLTSVQWKAGRCISQCNVGVDARRHHPGVRRRSCTGRRALSRVRSASPRQSLDATLFPFCRAEEPDSTSGSDCSWGRPEASRRTTACARSGNAWSIRAELRDGCRSSPTTARDR